MKKAVVIAPVSNLRREPIKATGKSQDKLQESQLLYGETVEVFEEKNSWCRIGALEQKKFLEERWVGYPGWVETKDLLFVDQFLETNATVSALWADITFDQGEVFSVTAGTRLFLKEGKLILPDGREGRIDPAALEKPSSADELVVLGKQRLGHPYLWGGRSAYSSKRPYTGCDCSGLVNLLYRIKGVDLPRDAHDQYLYCQPIEVPQVGDLVFLFSEKEREFVDHVMLIEDGHFLEATAKTGNVRRVSQEERLFGVSFAYGRALTSKGKNDKLLS